MGSNQATQNQEHLAFKSKHPLFRNAEIVKYGDSTFIHSRLPVQTKEYDAWKSIILDTKTPLNQEFLLIPVHTGFQDDKQLCSNSGTAINNYPYFPINLADEIAKRKPEHAFFKESELWYLLYVLVAAKMDLRMHGYRLGDVRPQSVFIDSKGNAKVANLLSAPNQTTAFTKAKNLQGEPLLLAPQDFILLSENAIDNKDNLKSEVFSIGATVIGAGLLDDLQKSYDYKKPRWVPQEFAVRRDKWMQSQRYSEILKSIVLNLVNEESPKRIGIEDLYRFISKYESSIKAKEQFIVSHPPQNLKSGVVITIVRSKVQI